VSAVMLGVFAIVTVPIWFIDFISFELSGEAVFCIVNVIERGSVGYVAHATTELRTNVIRRIMEAALFLVIDREKTRQFTNEY
jgi:hypothetical protein